MKALSVGSLLFFIALSVVNAEQIERGLGVVEIRNIAQNVTVFSPQKHYAVKHALHKVEAACKSVGAHSYNVINKKFRTDREPNGLLTDVVITDLTANFECLDANNERINMENIKLIGGNTIGN